MNSREWLGQPLSLWFALPTLILLVWTGVYLTYLGIQVFANPGAEAGTMLALPLCVLGLSLCAVAGSLGWGLKNLRRLSLIVIVPVTIFVNLVTATSLLGIKAGGALQVVAKAFLVMFLVYTVVSLLVYRQELQYRKLNNAWAGKGH